MVATSSIFKTIAFDDTVEKAEEFIKACEKAELKSCAKILRCKICMGKINVFPYEVEKQYIFCKSK